MQQMFTQNDFVIKFLNRFIQIKSTIYGAKLESYVESFKVLLFYYNYRSHTRGQAMLQNRFFDMIFIKMSIVLISPALCAPFPAYGHHHCTIGSLFEHWTMLIMRLQ